MLEEPLPAGTTRAYRVLSSPADDKSAFQCLDAGGKLVLMSGQKPMLTYHHQIAVPPPEMAAYYARSGFIHPLQTPSGRIVTDDFPPDHPHQHGVFRAWVDTVFRENKVDFWNQQGRTGNVRHVRIGQISGGDVFAEFSVKLEHVMMQPEQEPVEVINETWIVRGYQQGPLFVIDLESKQRAATDDPLLIRKYHYGGLAIRGHRTWDADSALRLRDQ